VPNPQPLRTNKQERVYESPVNWLLGRQLMGSIKGILLYAAYGTKLDPRDWMQASVFPDARRLRSLQLWQHEHEAAAHTQAEGSPVNVIDAEAFWTLRKEFWFDYLADAGDGTKAMYSLAYLCLSDLWVKPPGDQLPPGGDARKVKVRDNIDGFKMELPRGEFLFIGGDTAYHAADYMTLATRIQQPFAWAFEDLVFHGRISPDQAPRPLFGIPGNHDYYDQLDGFRRQFRHPIRPEPVPGAANLDTAQLGVAGFRRAQEASYVAVQLPFGWWLWGLDTEVGQLDGRQGRFFREFGGKKEDGTDDIVPPPKLIIATCSPTTFHGKIAEKKDYKAADAIAQLGLKQPFLPDGEKRTDGTYDLSTTGDVKIEPGECRLELSGDVHQYARYWGPKSPHNPPSRARAKAEAKTAESYASIVSGLGGAFHHPSTTYNDEVQEQVLYPSEIISRTAVAQKLFKFWNIWNGGYVWLAGFIIASVIYFAVTIPQSSRQFLSNIPPLASVLQLPRETITPSISLPADFDSSRPISALNESACGPVESFVLWRRLGLSKELWLPPQPCRPENVKYFFLASIADIADWPGDFKIGTLLVLGALIATIFTFLFSNKIFGTESEDPVGFDVPPSEAVMVGGEKRIKPRRTDTEIHAEPDKLLFGIVVPTSLAVFIGLLTLKPYRAHITPFVNSLLVLFSIIWAAAAATLGIRYSEFLFKKAHKHYIRKRDWVLPWGLSVISVLSLAMGFWFFGKNNPTAYLVSDIIFVVVLVGALVLLIVLPFNRGGELLKSRGVPKWREIVGKLLIGFWHALLQLAIPFLLIRHGDPLTWVVAGILLFLSIPVGIHLLKKNSKVGLSITWVLFGGLVLTLPWITSYFFSLPVPFAAASWKGWWGLWPSFLAGVAGAVMCCLWFGWYLAVCFIFNGHNNEVGGAARIEEFKQFIRFRVTEEGITGYVIAVDDVSMIGEEDPGQTRKKDGEYLDPKLIDVFHLKVKPASGH